MDKIGNKLLDIGIIIVSIIISVVLSTTVNLSKLELGALANIFFPPIIGIITIAIYFLGTWLIKKSRFFLIILLCLFNIFVGIFFHFSNF